MKIRKFYLLIFFLNVSLIKTYSQVSNQPTLRNLIYLEAFGMGGYGSLNYERIVFKQKKSLNSNLKIGLRLGISTLHLRDFTEKFNPDLIVPVSINAMYGFKHHLEVGVGQTLSNVVQTNATTFAIERKSTLNSSFNIGYRYQKPQGGVIFRVNYSPIISSNKVYNSWFGVSIGYGF